MLDPHCTTSLARRTSVIDRKQVRSFTDALVNPSATHQTISSTAREAAFNRAQEEHNRKHDQTLTEWRSSARFVIFEFFRLFGTSNQPKYRSLAAQRQQRVCYQESDMLAPTGFCSKHELESTASLRRTLDPSNPLYAASMVKNSDRLMPETPSRSGRLKLETHRRLMASH